MLHARREGETFGLAIAEFAAHNKPVITSRDAHDRGRARFHIDALGERGLFYHDKSSLLHVLQDFNRTAARQKDWRAYREFGPRPVMRQFDRVFLHAPSKLTKEKR